MKKRVFALVTAAVAVATVGAMAACGETTNNSIVAAIARESGSGTRGAFEELVKSSDGTTLEAGIEANGLASVVSEYSSTAAVISAVAQTNNTLGYVSLGSALANTSTVKAVNVEGVEATTANVSAGNYVLSRPFNIVYNTTNGLSEAAQDLMNYILSTEGQAVVEDNGYITVSTTSSYTSSLDSSKNYTIEINGSTSVGPLMVELYAEYKKLNTNVTINIQQTGSGTGISQAQAGTCDLGMSSRDLKDSETGLTCVQIATDGIAVIVSKDCALTNVTLDQLYQLYVNGTAIEF